MAARGVVAVEPAGHPAVKPYRDALVEDGIALAQVAVDSVEAEHARLVVTGVSFTQEHALAEAAASAGASPIS